MSELSEILGHPADVRELVGVEWEDLTHHTLELGPGTQKSNNFVVHRILLSTPLSFITILNFR